MSGQIKYIAPVDSVSGMFGKRSHSLSGKAIISNVRTAASQKFPKGHMYFSVLTKTTYGGSPTQKDWNQLFGAISSATHARMINPEYMDVDRAAFAKQTKYKTLYSYVWNQVKLEMV